MSQVTGAGWDLCRQRSAGGQAAPAVFRGQPSGLIWGSATLPDEAGAVHLAILCVQGPTCPVASDLAHLLDSLRPRTSAAAGGASGAQPSANLPDLAAQAGFRLVPLPVVLGAAVSP